MITRRYLRDLKPLEDPRAVYMLQLMTAHDVLRSAARWVKGRKPDKIPAALTEHLVGCLALASWFHAAIELLKKGWGQQRGLIDKGMLKGDSALESIWDELKCGNSRRLKLIERIRNKRLFHFDEDGAKRALQRMKEHEPSETPFSETVEPECTLDSRFPHAYFALSSALSDDRLEREELAKGMADITSVVHDVGPLLNALLEGIWKEIGIELIGEEDLKTDTHKHTGS